AAVFFTPGCKRGDDDIEREKGTPPVETVQHPPALETDPDPVQETGDITIGWIKRLPQKDFVRDSQNPTADGWPANGEQVVWRAYMKNQSSTAKQGVTFQWLLDGTVVSSGTIDIPAGSYVFTDLTWTWTFERRSLNFVVSPENGADNHLTIDTDALSLGLYVEQSVYDYFHRHQHKLGIGSNSFEGWAQRQMRMWNHILAGAVYPETPDGVLDRVRIDHITVVPDNALPLVNADGLTLFDPVQAIPNLNDRTVDMQWGFPVRLLGMYSDHTSLELWNQFYYSGFLQHELGHARYLIDLHGFNVHHGTAGGTIDIRENGALVAGSSYMQGVGISYNNVAGIRVQDTVEKGMMNSEWTYMDRYSAICLNLIAGCRATSGNYNAPDNLGVFLNDLPERNFFTILDRENYILKHADVRIYQSAAPLSPESAYPRVIDNTPDIYLTADASGRVDVGRCPFSPDGVVRHDEYVCSNVVFVMRVEHDGKVGYKIIDVARFNLEYWRGNTQTADYTIAVTML
ncbi:MAG: hypothetical protein GY765_34660, partial [bacterium]|nr:hypothetical protein [bacterium]